MAVSTISWRACRRTSARRSGRSGASQRGRREFRCLEGAQIGDSDWDFFYRCYERTYLEHGNAPYLKRDFFRRMARDMPGNWLMFIAGRGGRPIAASLVAIDGSGPRVAYGRYWGALERVDCLHFEACYYQPLQWCIANGYRRFEGGAQGEHKMARALMPVRTTSLHWLAQPGLRRCGQPVPGARGNGHRRLLGTSGTAQPLPPRQTLMLQTMGRVMVSRNRR